MKIFHLTTSQKECGITQYCISLAAALDKQYPKYDSFVDCEGAGVLPHFEEQSPDIVHVQWSGGVYLHSRLLELRERCRSRNIPFLMTLHNTVPRSLAYSPDLFLVHTQNEIRHLVDRGVFSSRIHAVSQGVLDLEVSNHGNPNTLALFGFLLPHKGILEVVQMVSEWRDHGENPPKLILQTPIHLPNRAVSEALYEKIQNFIQEHQLQNLITFYSDFVDLKTIVQRLEPASIMLYPYLHGAEQCSSAAISMGIAMERPCIISDIAFFSSISQGVVRFPSGHWSILQEAIVSLRNPEIYSQYYREILQLKERFSWDRVAFETGLIYEKALNTNNQHIVYPVSGSSVEARNIPVLPKRQAPLGHQKVIFFRGGGNVPYSFSHVLSQWAKTLDETKIAYPYVFDLSVRHQRDLGIFADIPEQCDAEVRFTYPPQFIYQPQSKIHCEVICWETTFYPEKWANDLNNFADRVIVPSRFSEEALLRSGVRSEKIHRVPLGIDCKIFTPTGIDFDWKRCAPVREGTTLFFHMAACDERKGTDILLEAYCQAFQENENVVLFIKNNSFKTILPMVRQFQGRFPACAPIILWEHEVETEMLASMMRSATVGVFPYRAEGGFGLVPAEMVSCGTPVILSNFGAPKEYLDMASACFIEGKQIRSTFKSQFHEEHPQAEWFMPDIEHLKILLRGFVDGIYEKSQFTMDKVHVHSWEDSASLLERAIFSSDRVS